MPTFRILRGATAYNVSNGQPIYIESIDDLGGAGVRNFEEQGPYQDGVSHLDYRLEPSIVTLRLFVKAATGTLLDAQRDTLNAMFKPVRGVPITLEVTRDDGEVRLLDTERFGRLGIRIQPQDNAGKLHRAVVQLRAGDPTWYDSADEEVDFAVPTTEWWLGYNTIGTANVLEHVESPTQGQAWAVSGSVASGSAWTIFFRGLPETPVGTVKYAFGVLVDAKLSIFQAFDGFGGGYAYQSGAASEQGAFMAPSLHDYFLVNYGGSIAFYRDTTLAGTALGTAGGIPASGSKRWRSDQDNNADSRWTQTLPYAAAYNVALSSVQRAALSDAIAHGSAFSQNVVYEGDWDTYPIIEIAGPIINPVISNAATGDELDFTGGTVGAGTIWTIDTRYGRKSAMNGTVSIANYLSNDSDLATFRIVPDPIVAGGTNTISISGSATGTATSITMAYRNRFLDY